MEPSRSKGRRVRRAVALLLAAGLAAGGAVVVWRDPDEAALTVKSRGTDPTTTTSTTEPSAGSTTTTTAGPIAPTTTAPPTTTSTAVSVTSTTVPAPPRLSCATADAAADARDGGVTVIGRDGDVRQLFNTRGMMSAVWAPDSARLAVNWLEADGGRVATVDLDGRVTLVSGADRVDRPLAWTPDGQVIYVATENLPAGPQHRVRLVSPTAARRPPSGRVERPPSGWPPWPDWPTAGSCSSPTKA